MIRAIIVDDEQKAAKLLKLLIEEIADDIEITAVYNDSVEALANIDTSDVDVLFLDIHMPNMSGFELSAQLKGDVSVVFVTGHDQYALEALKMAAVGYILKPIEEEELSQVLNRVRKNETLKNNNEGYQVLLENMRVQNIHQRRIGIPSTSGIDFVMIENIISCEGVDGYTKVYIHDGRELLSSYNLGEFVKMIGDAGFYQVHRSYIVNMRRIRQYQNDGVLLMDNDISVPVSRRRREGFLHSMNTVRR